MRPGQRRTAWTGFGERLMEQFSAVLQEKLLELDADEAAQARLTSDPIERLCLATQQVILAVNGTILPRQGHQAYMIDPVTEIATDGRKLDILS